MNALVQGYRTASDNHGPVRGPVLLTVALGAFITVTLLVLGYAVAATLWYPEPRTPDG